MEVGRIQVLDKGFVELIDVMGDDFTPVDAARVSLAGERYDDEERNIKLTNYLLDNHHTTPFEMVELKFRVKLPLFVARQWMRHRTWSYNEVSMRYTEPDYDFYEPYYWRYQSTSNKQGSEGIIEDDNLYELTSGYYESCENAIQIYKNMIGNGVAREMARMVLPVSMYTTFIAKVDLNNFIKFLKLRLDPHAQYEIRQYSEAMLDLFIQQFPTLGDIIEGKFF